MSLTNEKHATLIKPAMSKQKSHLRFWWKETGATLGYQIWMCTVLYYNLLKAIWKWNVDESRWLPGVLNYFLTRLWGRAEVWKPLPTSKDFSHSKKGWLDSFFKIFSNQDTISNGVSKQTWTWPQKINLISELYFYSQVIANTCMFSDINFFTLSCIIF